MSEIPIWPDYRVLIRNNATGEVRERQMALPWYEHSLFWWTEGNFGCDCNREWQFQRAAQEEESEDPKCGDRRYTAIKAIFPDGSELRIDEVADSGVGEAFHEVES